MTHRPLRRVRSWFRSAAEIERDIDEEIGFHLEMRAATLMQRGLTAAAAAEQAAREFGDARGLRRSLRRRDGRAEWRRRVWTWLSDVNQDVRFALRSVVRARGFSAVALFTLMLGIGASVAMFTVVNAVLLRPLPYPAPDQLVHVWPGNNFNIALADEVAAGAPSLAAVTGLTRWGLTLREPGDAAVLMAQGVDAAFFEVFGVRPSPGRPIRPEERDPTRSDVVILSHDLWQTRFGGAAGVIGQRIALDGYGHATREVIGVMPRGFVAPLADGGERVNLWVPLHVPPGRTVATDSTWYVNNVVGRLRPGAGVAGVAAEVGTLLDRVRQETGGLLSEEAVRSPGALPLHDSLVSQSRNTLWLLLGAVGLVLLLTCANLANLLLARGERRRPELAARAALGASRGRLIRELMTEGAVLTAMGAAGGLLLARLILDVLRVGEASGLPRMAQLAIDVRVVAFAALVAGGALVLFALLPALRATAGDLRPALGAARRAPGRTRGGRRIGFALIAAEVALAMVLVTGAALLIQSFRTVRAVDPGMTPEGVLAVQLQPPPAEYEGQRAGVFYAELLERLRALPAVRAAGAIHLLPFTQNNWGFPYLAEGHTPPINAPLPSANFRVVTPGYFAAVGVPLHAGRDFDTRDEGGAAVGMINRTLAEQLWPGQEAVGRVINLFGNTPFRVIGVVGDVHQHALDAQPSPEMYRPLAQWPVSGMVVMLRADGDAAALVPAVRQVVAALDRGVPIVDARPLADVLDDSLATRRFIVGVLTFFGVLALLLGAVGVYGVMTYAVSARYAEFGVRLALGATHRDVLRDALRGGLAPVLLGLTAGLLASLAANRLLESLLFGVQPRDPRVLAAAALVLGGSALLASWLPARRVTRVEPVSALEGS
jgi:putative ABC transport system permease protein